QKLRLAVPEGPAANKETTDPVVIDDVIRTLRDVAPSNPPVTAPPFPLTGSPTKVYGILLFSDQLPGLVFRPSFYLAESGQVYLADSLVVRYTRNEQTVQAAWIPASPSFTRWVQTR